MSSKQLQAHSITLPTVSTSRLIIFYVYEKTKGLESAISGTFELYLASGCVWRSMQRRLTAYK